MAVRALILILLAVSAASALGCQESGFDERKETARPLKVQHVLGVTKVPGQAQRPLPLTMDSLDDTLALGLHPAGAAAPGLRLPAYLRGPAGNLRLIRPVTGRADLPRVVALHPDLILGNATGQSPIYTDLTAIAPTVITADQSGQWKLTLRLVGEALGRTNDVEGLLTDYDRRVAQVRRLVKGRQTPKVAVVRASAGSVQVASPDSFAATILADAGLVQAQSVEAADVVVRGDQAAWWGPGGMLAARAALADLQRILPK
jgi:iron complex transport system substrate-binding protein